MHTHTHARICTPSPGALINKILIELYVVVSVHVLARNGAKEHLKLSVFYHECTSLHGCVTIFYVSRSSSVSERVTESNREEQRERE